MKKVPQHDHSSRRFDQQLYFDKNKSTNLIHLKKPFNKEDLMKVINIHGEKFDIKKNLVAKFLNDVPTFGKPLNS